MSNYLNWIADGTFKSVPKCAYQLYTVHALLPNTHQTVVCAFAIMSGKDKEMYTESYSLKQSRL